MEHNPYRYAVEKLNAALRILTIPVRSNAEAYAAAYHELTLGMKDVPLEDDERARLFHDKIVSLMEGAETWEDAARKLNNNDQHDLTAAFWDLHHVMRVREEEFETGR